MEKISIDAPGGKAPVYIWDTKAPTVLVYMDGVGMRPAIREVAAKIADHGYRVVMPDLFYRLGDYTPPPMAEMFGKPEVQKDWWGKVTSIMTPDNIQADLACWASYIGGPFGVTGYCMGGRLAIVTAEMFPDQVRAAGAYHPGGLVTEEPHSPHRSIAQIKGKVYIGRAKDDAHFTDAHLATLEKAIADAHVDAKIETYNAKHGWVPTDSPVHDAAEAARHFETTFALFDSALPRA
ncbi:MAG TPA: dienelactone hydrolase family protein [Kofleriaceae bacterium]